MKIIVIDNYDSFTYNLVHMLSEFGAEVTIKRNDQFHLDELVAFDKIMISPGPGIPSEAGQTKEVIFRYAGKKPILGVCLGHQAIADCYGGNLINLEQVYHGIGTAIHVEKDYLFQDCPSSFKVGRYHSWSVDNNLPQGLESLGVDENGIIMALKHKEYDLRGVQFHPESILTPLGKTIIKNWVNN